MPSAQVVADRFHVKQVNNELDAERKTKIEVVAQKTTRIEQILAGITNSKYALQK